MEAKTFPQLKLREAPKAPSERKIGIYFQEKVQKLMDLDKTFPQCPKIENLTPMIIGGYSILFTPVAHGRCNKKKVA